MRYFLLFLALVCGGPACCAQAPLPLPQAELLGAASPAADTVAAIHRLFAKRRLRRNLIASGLGAGVLVGAAISSANTGDSGHGSSGYGSLGGGLRFDAADYLLIYAIPATPLILLDFVVYANYSRKREAWVVEEFQAHRLPAKLRHKLKPRYFR